MDNYEKNYISVFKEMRPSTYFRKIIRFLTMLIIRPQSINTDKKYYEEFENISHVKNVI
jgi:hypothetical protein